MTPLQLGILDQIRDTLAHCGTAPTIREIAGRQGCSSTFVHKTIDALVDDGVLNRVPAKARGLTLAYQPDVRVAPTDTLRAELARRGFTLEALNDGSKPVFRGARSCAVNSCRVEVRVGQLMCRNHWYALPLGQRDAIVRAHSGRDVERYQQLVSEARDSIAAGATA